MPTPGTLAVFLTASLALLLFPGPAVLYVVTRSIAGGRRTGLLSVLGVEVGNLVHVVAAAVGISALVASSASAFAAVKYAGGAYLLWLGVRQLRRGGPQPAAHGAALPAYDGSGRRAFLHGTAVGALNPKTALFFLAFLPQFVDPVRGPGALQLLALGVAFVALATLTDSGYALLSSLVRPVLVRPSTRHRLDRASGGAYVVLGALALTTRRAASA